MQQSKFIYKEAQRKKSKEKKEKNKKSRQQLFLHVPSVNSSSPRLVFVLVRASGKSS